METIERCPVCGGGERWAICAHGRDFDGEVVQACRRCGVYYLSPRLDAAEVEEYYRATYSQRYRGGERPDAAALARRDAIARDRYRRLTRLGVLTRGRTLFEIGCGAGNFLALCAEAGVEAWGVEPSRGYAEVARECGMAVETGRFPAAAGPRPRYDVVVMFHVVEHLGEPAAALEAVRRLLAPGGTLVVEVPDLARALGPRWSERYFHRPHLLDFTAASLDYLLARCGFIVRVREWAADQPGRRHHLLVVAEPDAGAAPVAPPARQVARLAARVRRRLRLAAWLGPPFRRARALLRRLVRRRG